jgi:hypothetical protein
MPSSRTAKLELPASLAIHSVVDISKLRRFIVSDESKFPNRISTTTLPSPIIVDDQEEWEVQAILAKRLFGRWKSPQYKVHWKGFPITDAAASARLLAELGIPYSNVYEVTEFTFLAALRRRTVCFALRP